MSTGTEKLSLRDEIGRIDVSPTLSGIEVLPSDSRQRLLTIDRDIAASRFESALDLTLAVASSQPEFIPNFVRAAELMIVTKNQHNAVALIETIVKLSELRGDRGQTVEIARILTHADPTLENAIDLTEFLIQERRTGYLERYAPVAINGLIKVDDQRSALDLAQRWYQSTGADQHAHAYLVREFLRQGRSDEAIEAVHHCQARIPTGGHTEAFYAASFAATAAANLPERWDLTTAASESVRKRQLNYQELMHWYSLFDRLPNSSPHWKIPMGVVALSAGILDDAEGILTMVSPADPIETYVTNAALARLWEQRDDSINRLNALRYAFQSTASDEASSFANSNMLFTPQYTISRLGLDLIELLTQRQELTEASQVVQRLLTIEPQNEQITRLHAEILGKSGDRNAAVRQLEEIFQQQESAGNHQAAIQTLETMVKVVPGNLSIRNRLIEKYMRRGKLAEAIEQLIMEAKILRKAKRYQDARDPLQRANEIASMTGDWQTVEQINSMLIQLSPDDTSLRHAAVATYVQYGRISQAMSELDQIVKIASERDDPDEAIAALHQMLALNPNEPSTYHQLGELLISISEYGQAERVYRRLGALVPDDPSVRAKQDALKALMRSQ